MLEKNKQFNLNLSIIIILVFAFSLAVIFCVPSFINNTPLSSLPEKDSQVLPLRLRIPSINIDTTVEDVGLTSAGAMDVPKEPEDVAWFDLGPSPGQIGSAVIDGHSGWKDNEPAVFDSLYKLQKGDKIYIEDNTGVTITFVVRKIKDYNPNGDDGDVFSSSDGLAHLNLITCSGTWNVAEQTHSARLVVFTDRE